MARPGEAGGYMGVFKDLADGFPLSPRYMGFEEMVEYIYGKVREAIAYDSYVDILVQGQQGLGKSTIALAILLKHYGDLDKSLSNTFFTVDDLTDVLLREKREVVLLDDAGVTLNKWRATSREAVDYYVVQQLARTRVKAILYTTVHSNIAKFLREIADVVVNPQRRSGDIIYGAIYERTTKLYTITKKKTLFKIDLRQVHGDKALHELYVAYNKRREQFVLDTITKLKEKRAARATPTKIPPLPPTTGLDIFELLDSEIQRARGSHDR